MRQNWAAVDVRVGCFLNRWIADDGRSEGPPKAASRGPAGDLAAGFCEAVRLKKKIHAFWGEGKDD